jgi:hypothetical protein
MRRALNMGKVVKNITEYDDIADQDVLRIETDEGGIRAMEELMARMHKRGVDPSKCVFYMHPDRFHDVQDEMMYAVSTGGFKGRPVRLHDEVPLDLILFLAPDAVAMGGKVYNPLPVGYARLEGVETEEPASEEKIVEGIEQLANGQTATKEELDEALNWEVDDE